jgi:acetyl esterase/lipase
VAAFGCGGGTDPGPGLELGPPAHLVVVSGDGQTGRVGEPLARPVVVRVTDTAGRPLPGEKIGFAGATWSADTVRGDENGEAAAVWTLGTRSGPAGGTVGVRGLEPLSVSATAQAGPPAILAFDGSPGSRVARETWAPPVRVLVEDRYGNLVTDSHAAVALRLNHGTLLGTSVREADSGSAVFGDLHVDLPGTGFVLTAFNPAIGEAVSGPFDIAGLPATGPVDAIRSELTATPATVAVGESSAIRVVARDAFDNPVKGATVVLGVSGSENTISQPPATNSAGTARGALQAASPGERIVTATVDGIVLAQQATVAVSLGAGTISGLAYCTMGDAVERMDVYIPDTDVPRPRAVVVHIHGGGWVSGDRTRGVWFVPIRDRLLAEGFVVVSIDYRLAPANKWPAQLQDVKCAVRHLRANAARYGLDPARIGVVGSSAGGQLAALLGTTEPDPGIDDVGDFEGVSSRVQAVVALSPITDFTAIKELRDDYGRVFRTWPDPESPEMIGASPVTHVSSGDSPFFFVTGEDDSLVLPEQSARMHRRLGEAGVSSTLVTIAHADHGLSPTTAPIDPAMDEVIERIVTFLDQRLR